jgi:hypothetical protein
LKYVLERNKIERSWRTRTRVHERRESYRKSKGAKDAQPQRATKYQHSLARVHFRATILFADFPMDGPVTKLWSFRELPIFFQTPSDTSNPNHQKETVHDLSLSIINYPPQGRLGPRVTIMFGMGVSDGLEFFREDS